MRCAVLLRAVPLLSPVFRPGPDRLRVLKMSRIGLFQPDPCSRTRAFLDNRGLQACGFDTTGAIVGNWYLRVVGSSTPAARFRCPGPSLSIGGRAFRKTFTDRLTQRNSGDLVRQPPSTWIVDSGPSSVHSVCYQVAGWCSEDNPITRNSNLMAGIWLQLHAATYPSQL